MKCSRCGNESSMLVRGVPKCDACLRETKDDKRDWPLSFSTPMAAATARLLGYDHCEGVGFSPDETSALAEFYSVDLKSDEIELTQAGNRRNLYRAAKEDGLPVMAFLAQYLERGEDPVQLVAQGLAAMGFDVCLEEDEEYPPLDITPSLRHRNG